MRCLSITERQIDALTPMWTHSGPACGDSTFRMDHSSGGLSFFDQSHLSLSSCTANSCILRRPNASP